MVTLQAGDVVAAGISGLRYQIIAAAWDKKPYFLPASQEDIEEGRRVL